VVAVYSKQGPTRAWDVWGGSIRSAYKTVKRADEDVFLAALTLWTDNGAATLGAAWGVHDPEVVAPPFTHTEAPGGVVPANGVTSYMNWNWSMVDTGEHCLR